jgi:glycosyltransferase involved in cell wall biosynthesis
MKPVEGLVSVILPVHNDEATLSSCLDSLLSQTYKDLEIIVIDDHSKDSSNRILKTYKKRDSRLKLFRNVKHYGMTITMNRALSRAKGQFIAFMQPSDTCTIDRIKRQVALFFQNPKIVAAGTQCVFIDENGKTQEKSMFPTNHEKIVHTLFNGVTMQYETAIINRFRIPKDLLKFSPTKANLLFSDLFAKLQQYGQFANTQWYLYRKTTSTKGKIMSLKKIFFEHVGLLAKARFSHNYDISLDALVSPLVKN